MSGAFFPTITGKFVDVLNLTTDDINAYDIAWALSKTNRYNGMAPVAWDVLSHTGLAYMLYVKNTQGQTDPTTTLALMLHDASEAYLGDIIALLKRSTVFDAYRDLEEQVTRIIFERFGLDFDVVDWETVSVYDRQATAIELELFFPEAAKRPEATQRQYTMTWTPVLVKAQVADYIEFLKQMLTVTGQDLRAVFEAPESMLELLKPKEQPQAGSSARRSIDTDLSDVEAMRL